MATPERNMSRILTIAALVLATACGARTQSPARGPNNVVTQDEIATVPADNAYDAIEHLRPQFLRPHVTGSRRPAYAVVFIDGVRRGGPEILRSIAAKTVAQVRYLTSADATTRYGLDIEGGVIEVTLGLR
jgi:hypothetical protein